MIGWEIQVFDAQSLKQKRAVIKSLKARLHNRLNISVAETDYQDLWQRAELTACVVATDRRQAESILDRADRMVAAEALGRIIDSYRTFY
ncbi:MAG TPA: DUF503 domain-containing protein [Longimicrobiales bacterium]|nr:DUF503 domain-containing protein [Longimicrobiales bacterium]